MSEREVDWQAWAALVALFSRKWAVPVLEQLHGGPKRNRDLIEVIDKNLHQQSLSDILDALEEWEIVYREFHPGSPNSEPNMALYGLTDLGRRIIEPVAVVSSWLRARPELREAIVARRHHADGGQAP